MNVYKFKLISADQSNEPWPDALVELSQVWSFSGTRFETLCYVAIEKECLILAQATVAYASQTERVLQNEFKYKYIFP
jgi:hypothetical protein